MPVQLQRVSSCALTLILLTMSISDDARGLPTVSARFGVGLRSMRERVSELGGTMTVDSSSGVGTTISITLPRTPSTWNEPADVR